MTVLIPEYRYSIATTSIPPACFLSLPLAPVSKTHFFHGSMNTYEPYTRCRLIHFARLKCSIPLVKLVTDQILNNHGFVDDLDSLNYDASNICKIRTRGSVTSDKEPVGVGVGVVGVVGVIGVSLRHDVRHYERKQTSFPVSLLFDKR